MAPWFRIPPIPLANKMLEQWLLKLVQVLQSSSPPGDHKVSVSVADPTAGFLGDKTTPGDGVALSVDPGELLRVALAASPDGSIAAGPGSVQVGVLASDAQHGARGGGTQHADATNVAAGFMSAADKAKLDDLGPIERTLTVGLSGGVDYNSPKAAIDAAILGGASAASPWLIKVYPGTYIEQPMTLQPGVCLVAEANRITTAIIVAANPAADLFTCTGGYVAGIRAEGVTDPARALFRCATALTRTVLHGVSMRNCSTGLAVSNGATAILTNVASTIEGPAQSVTTVISISDPSSYLGIVGGFFSVPAAVLGLYPGTNPIQTCVAVSNGADANIVGATFLVAHNDNSADAVFVDSGARMALFSSQCEGCANGVHIGAGGANTRAVIQSARFVGNVVNGRCDSATGVFLVSAEADDIKFVTVAGAKLSGLIQLLAGAHTLVAGDVDYSYPDGRTVDFGEYLHEFGSTGLAYGGDVTEAGGLFVDVGAGEGYCSRTADHDIENVDWSPVAGLALTPNATNYVHYDDGTSSITVDVAPPGPASILLATVLTDGAGVRYLHKTRNVMYQPEQTLHQYLLDTRRIAWLSGLVTTQGSTNRRLDVASGAWYVATEALSVLGGADVQFAYYYGPGAASQIPGLQTDLDNTRYDNAGVLTPMTAGYYRADTVVVTSDNRVSVIYGTSQHSTPAAAAATTNKAPMPGFLDPTGCFTALVVVQQAGGIAQIVDIRPNPNAATGGGAGGTNNHSALINLLNDDHPQYLRTDGARVMTGSLDMGGNNIANVTLVAGVNVPAHGSRHNPGGVDAIATGAPVAVLAGAAPSAGSDPSVARSDHQHGITVGNPVSVGAANLPGTASSVAASDHQHNHGAQTDPAQHAVATPGANGFMSAADKTKLDGLSGGTPDSIDTIPAPVFSTNAAQTFALAANYVGAAFNVPRACSFANAYVRITGSTPGSQVRVAVYQQADGNSGVATLVASGQTSVGGGGALNLTIPMVGALKQGLAWILIGRANVQASTARTYGNTSMDGLNANVVAGKAPVTFTTAISASGAPATFNPVADTTASTGNVAPVVRLGA